MLPVLFRFLRSRQLRQSAFPFFALRMATSSTPLLQHRIAGQVLADASIDLSPPELNRPSIATATKCVSEVASTSVDSEKFHSCEQECLRLARSGQFRQCFSLLDALLYRDRVTPSQSTFSAIINLASKSGHLEKALEYIEKMQDFGHNSHDIDFIPLFNSCAQSRQTPRPLTTVFALRDRMIGPANENVYHAMMRAFANCGDLDAVLNVVDRMSDAGLEPNADTFKRLLVACRSDKTRGFTYAILVARKMLHYPDAVSPTSISVLLTVCLKCGMGDVNFVREKLNVPASAIEDREGTVNRFSSSRGTVCESLSDYVLHPEFVPPAGFAELLAVEASSEKGTPTGRFALVGGVDGVLHQMDLLGLAPSTVHFAQLELGENNANERNLTLMTSMLRFSTFVVERTFEFLQLIPNTTAVDAFLLERMSDRGIRHTAPFVIQLTSRRVTREDRHTSIADFLADLSQHKLVLDPTACSWLALRCGRSDDMHDLLAAMKERAIRPDIEFFEQLIETALLKRINPTFALAVLRELDRVGLVPGDEFRAIVEEGIEVLDGVCASPRNEFFASRTFRARCASFKEAYQEMIANDVLSVIARTALRAGREKRWPKMADFIDDLSKHKLVIDSTVCVALALQCGRSEDMDDLLEAMKHRSLPVNLELFTQLMHSALGRKSNPVFAVAVLRAVDRTGLHLSDEFRRVVEQGVKKLDDICAMPLTEYSASRQFRTFCRRFKREYQNFGKESPEKQRYEGLCRATAVIDQVLKHTPWPSITSFLNAFSEQDMKLDLVAFEALARKCTRSAHVDQLFEAMKVHHIDADMNIFEKLLGVALHMKFDPQFALTVLRELERRESVPSEMLRQTVEQGIEILDKICAKPRNNYFKSGEFREGCVSFKSAYREYLLKREVASLELVPPSGGEKPNLTPSQAGVMSAGPSTEVQLPPDDVRKAVNAKVCINILMRAEAKVTPRSS